MNDIMFSCPGCGTRIVVFAHAAGTSMSCPQCGALVVVPECMHSDLSTPTHTPRRLWLGLSAETEILPEMLCNSEVDPDGQMTVSFIGEHRKSVTMFSDQILDFVRAREVFKAASLHYRERLTSLGQSAAQGDL